MTDSTLLAEGEECTETHPVVGLTCYKKGPHFAHFCERSKDSATYHAKDVWVWWEGAFTKKGRYWPNDG